MFEKYITEIKEKPFIVAFLILLAVSCVTYSYHFQIMFNTDDVQYLRGYWHETVASYWSTLFKVDPRALGSFLSSILNDGTNAKNIPFFMNLLVSSGLALIFTRVGLGIKSIFWSVLIATPLITSAGMFGHYVFNVNVIRYIPAFYIVALAASVLVKPKIKNIAIVVLLLWFAVWTYQLSLLMFVGGMAMLIVKQIMEQQEQPLKQIAIDVLKQKIIPGAISAILAVLVFVLWNKIFLHATGDKAFSWLASVSKILANFDHQTHIILNYLMFNTYPANLAMGHLIFGSLLLSALIATFVYAKRQGMVKASILTISVLLIFFVMFVVLNIGQYASGRVELRLITQDVVIFPFLLYLNYLGWQHINKLQTINAILSFIFVMQICQETNYKSFRHLLVNQERLMTNQRLFTDVLNYAREQKINHKLTVYFLHTLEGERVYDLQIPKKYKRLHYYETSHYMWSRYRFQQSFFRLTGVSNYMKLPQKNYKKLFNACVQVMSDKTINKWPYYNSMTIIDDIIYVKMSSGNNKLICNETYNDSYVAVPAKLPMREGYLDFSK